MVNYYHFRTFRVFKLENKTEIAYVLDCENGRNEWRVSSSIKSIKQDIKTKKYHIITKYGSEYICGRYQPVQTTTTIDNYCKINGFTKKHILTKNKFFNL